VRWPGASAGIAVCLARLRWSRGATDTIETGASIVPRFSITRVTTSDAPFAAAFAVWDGMTADTMASE
jgi:hypothetical protein